MTRENRMPTGSVPHVGTVLRGAFKGTVTS
jgi:hypothetical protein